ncbi:MAG: YIP1 family protein, partial [Methanocorpusculum sp.]|nr:YIP1 family protein [Methanocorpusculum sp.]
LFQQKEFFEHDAPKGVKLPLLLTIIYSVVAALSVIPALGPALAMVPEGLHGIGIGTSVIGTIVTIIISWLFVALIFFAFVKIVGYATCSYKEVLSVTGYVSVLLIICSILTFLVSMIGSANSIALLLLNGAFLLWSIPVWYFGLASVCGDIPKKKLVISIVIPVLIMVIVSVVSTMMAVSQGMM